MAANREIPGFFYDGEKGKYFRIQPNHRAPQGSAYSRSAVNAKKKSSRLENDSRIRQARIKAECIHRVDPSSYTGLSLNLRHGQSPHKNIDSLTYQFAADLACRSANVARNSELRSFDVSRGGGLYVSTKELREGSDILTVTSSMGKPLPRPIFHEAFFNRQNSTVRSGLVVVDDNTFAGYRGREFFYASTRSSGEPSGHVRVPCGAQIWDIAATQTSSSHHIALATQDGLQFSDLSHEHHQAYIKDELTRVTFKDPNIIMASERRAIHFTDLRVPCDLKSSAVHRLQHSSFVDGMLPARHNDQIIVSGLESTSLYDLRYAKAVVTPKWKKNKKARIVPPTPQTEPLVPFGVPDDRRSQAIGCGKSSCYIASLDIVIVVSRDPTPDCKAIVTPYKVSTGRMLSSPLANIRFEEDIIGIAAGRVRDGPESVFVGTRQKLFEWSVEHSKDKDQGHSSPQNTGSRVRTVKKVLCQDSFPPDGIQGIAELWNKGDAGPI